MKHCFQSASPAWRRTPLAVLLLATVWVMPAVVRAETTLWLDSGQASTLAIALSTDIDIEVSGMLAHALVTQRFVNQTDAWVEGRYVFPLPDDSAVESLRIVVGDRLIEGEIQEREQARATYQQARSDGRMAGLVEQSSGDRFATRIANIAPGQSVEIQIGFRPPIDYQHGQFRLRVPTTMVPRHPGASLEAVTGDAQSSPRAARWPPAERANPPITTEAGYNPFSLSVVVNTGTPLAYLESLHHRVDQACADGRCSVLLEEQVDSERRDFELIWQVQDSGQPHPAVFRQSLGGLDHALIMLVPPQQFSARRTPREVLLVIDTSGSMQGASLEQARAGLRFALDHLGHGDHFNLVEFNDRAHALFARSLAVDGSTIKRARDWVRGLEANGGTEMLDPLDLALNGGSDSGLLRQIVFITDGQVSNESSVLGLVHERLGQSRLFTVGIGHGVNSQFLRDLARFGRGSHVLIADSAQVVERMGELLTQLNNPVLHDIEIHWPDAVEAVPERIPDLYAGQPLLIGARAARLDGPLLVTGFSDGRPWQRLVDLDQAWAATGVAAFWGRRAIQQTLDRQLLAGAPDAVRRDVLGLAIEYQLLSPFTSLVAVDRTPGRSRQAALESHRLPGRLPSERIAQARMMPATDAGSIDALLRGGLAVVLIVILLMHRRFNPRADIDRSES